MKIKHVNGIRCTLVTHRRGLHTVLIEGHSPLEFTNSTIPEVWDITRSWISDLTK